MATAAGARRSSSSRRDGAWAAAGTLVLCVTLAACDRSAHGSLEWAKSAVARNASLELVSTDPTSDTLTVRVRTTGEIRHVRADELVAVLPGAGAGVVALTQASAPPAVPTGADSIPSPPAAAPSPPPGVPSGAIQRDAAPIGAPQGDAPESAAAADSTAASSSGATAPAPAALTANESAKASITRASADASAPEASAADLAGHKVVSGPGYSIAVVGAATTPVVVRDPMARNAPVELRHEPIVCQGGQLMHIDNRNLEFEGDALAAEDGCDLHITNSRISAQGTAVLARAARVHIENSSIEGEKSSIEASQGAQVYAQSSTFKGVIHRVDGADFHDTGGNVGN